MARQKLSFDRIYQLTTRSYHFADKKSARDYFTRLTGLFKNYNYASSDSPEHDRYLLQIDQLAAAVPEEAPAAAAAAASSSDAA
jgi:V/A-type H+-transporting ATPase subunit A